MYVGNVDDVSIENDIGIDDIETEYDIREQTLTSKTCQENKRRSTTLVWTCWKMTRINPS